MWISPVPLMWVARVTCATLYVLGNWNATWCGLPCKGQQNSSKTLSSLCWCSSTSLAFSLLTQVTIFFTICFQVQFQSHIFFTVFFTIYFQAHFKSQFFFAVFLQINYFMVSRGWLKSPFTKLLYLTVSLERNVFSPVSSKGRPNSFERPTSEQIYAFAHRCTQSKPALQACNFGRAVFFLQ